MEDNKRFLSLRVRQALVISAILILMLLGIIFLFGEQTEGFEPLMYVLIKVIGCLFLALAVAILRGIMPNVIE